MCLSPQLHKYFPITIVHYGAGRRAGLGVGGVRGAHDLGRVLAMRAFWDGAFVKAGMIVHTVCGVLTYSVPPLGAPVRQLLDQSRFFLSLSAGVHRVVHPPFCRLSITLGEILGGAYHSPTEYAEWEKVDGPKHMPGVLRPSLCRS
jgi:hypothetical protein